MIFGLDAPSDAASALGVNCPQASRCSTRRPAAASSHTAPGTCCCAWSRRCWCCAAPLTLARGAMQLPRALGQLRDAAVDVLRFARSRAMPYEARLESRTIIPDYDSLSVEQIRDWLTRLSQGDLATVDAYERATHNHTPIVETIRNLQGREPWPGYDTMTVMEIRSRLRDADDGQVRAVLDYERGHKDRSSILNASEIQAAAAA
ncbi:hypothetical protein [Dactylosporangium sp. NPDC051484]|uniref:hypothetical protein n=1 Tax=Dactylosporangium sp. NPDC051484 TaxID=3154942 RepID=UPI00344DE448